MLRNWKELENDSRTWKWIWLVSLFISIVFITSHALHGEIDLTSVSSVIVVTALYGLAYEKPIWSIRFWKIVFWFIAVSLCMFMIIFVLQFVHYSNIEQTNESSSVNLFEQVIGYFLLIFPFIELRGLYLYVYKRSRIWAVKIDS